MSNNNLESLINEFLQYCEVERNLSQGTVKMYHLYLTEFYKFTEQKLGRAPSQKDITKELVSDYRVYLNRKPSSTDPTQTLSKATQNCFLIALRSFLKYLSVQKDMQALDSEKITLAKTPDRIPKFLSEEDLEILFSRINISKKPGLRDRAILELLYSTGLRVSELTGLNKGDITKEVLSSREFGVIGKGRKARTVFLTDASVYWLKRYLAIRNDDYKPLFIRYSGKYMDENDKTGESLRINPRSVQRMVKKYTLKAGLATNVTPHVLRHSFATHILKKGGDIRSVQELLGHSNIATTQIYTHLTNKDLKETHKKFHNKTAPGKVEEDAKQETVSVNQTTSIGE